MHIAIVFNPHAGPRAASAVHKGVTESLRARGHEVDVLESHTPPGMAHALTLNAHRFERAIVIGGDGTLNAVVNGILNSQHPDLPIAFLPTGRGKDTARSLPSWNQESLCSEAFDTASHVPVDLIRITLADSSVRYGINISDIGIAAHAASVANRLPRFFSSLSYVLGAVRSMMPIRSFELSARIDGEPVHIDNALLLSVCNGKTFGGGIHISPTSDVTDGVLDVVIARNANLLDLALQLPRLKRGTLYEHRALRRWRGTSIEIDPVHSPWFEVDGERLPLQPVRYDVAPAALNWITPS